jgi:hypothetical protein
LYGKKYKIIGKYKTMSGASGYRLETERKNTSAGLLLKTINKHFEKYNTVNNFDYAMEIVK